MTDIQLRQHRFFRQQKILTIQALHSGFNHHIHKVVCENMLVIARQAKGPEAQQALQLQQELAHIGITAEVFDDDNNLAIMQFIDGVHPAPDFWQSNTLETLSVLLTTLHQYRPTHPTETLTLKPYIKHYIDSANLNNEHTALCQLAENKLEALYQLPLSLGLCHHDLNPKNLIIEGDKIWLIDWEGANIGDRFFDLASFIIEQQLDSTNERLFLQHYLQRNPQTLTPQQVTKKLELMKIAYCLVCWLWYLDHEQQDKASSTMSVHFHQLLQQYMQN